MPPTINMTVSVPEGTTDHGTPNLICPPTQWFDIIVFFFINYLAHVFTLISSPGATPRELFLTGLAALLVPASGIIRSFRWIFSHAAMCTENPVEQAIRAGAVCMLLREENIDPNGQRDEKISGIFKNDRARIIPLDREIHGTFIPPKDTGDYHLVQVPPNTPITEITREAVSSIYHRRMKTSWDRMKSWVSRAVREEEKSTPASSTTPPKLADLYLPHTWNIVQLLVGLIQAVYGVNTLYKATDNQIGHYGIAAFGLTVTPYAFMSLVNIVASILTPSYPAMYLIWTPDLERAKVKHGWQAEGYIAKLDVKKPRGERSKIPFGYLDNQDLRSYLYKLSVCLSVAAPIAVNLGVSKARLARENNQVDRIAWILLWLLSGVISPLYLQYVERVFSGQWIRKKGNWSVVVFWFLYTSLLWVPGIGGMVHVGLMLEEYGACTKLDFNPF